MAIEKNLRDFRVDSELFRGSVEMTPRDDEEPMGHAECDDDNDEFGDADSGAGSDEFDLLELGEPGTEFCQVGGSTCSIPFELYDVLDLADVLTVDAWNEILTEEDRVGLTQYLPDLDQEMFMRTVKELLEGANFHFGSPMKKLLDMMRGGLCEPRVVLCRHALHSFQKSQHYHFLRSYHNSMVTKFCCMRDVWAGCDGYDIEEKLGVLDATKHQQQPGYKREEDSDSNLALKEECRGRSWSRQDKHRKGGLRLGCHPAAVSGMELPHLDSLPSSGAAKHEKKSQKGMLKLAGPKVSPAPRERNQFSSTPRHSKVAGMNSGGFSAMLREKIEEEEVEDEEDEAEEEDAMVPTRDQKGRFLKIKKKDSHSLLGFPVDSRGDFHVYSRKRSSNQPPDGLAKSLNYKEKNMSQSGINGQLRPLRPPRLPRFTSRGDQADRLDHLEPLWKMHKSGMASVMNSSCRPDRQDSKSKKPKMRNAPPLRLHGGCSSPAALEKNGAHLEYAENSSRKKARSLDRRAMKKKTARVHSRSEETESDSSGQLGRGGDADAGNLPRAEFVDDGISRPSRKQGGRGELAHHSPGYYPRAHAPGFGRLNGCWPRPSAPDSKLETRRRRFKDEVVMGAEEESIENMLLQRSRPGSGDMDPEAKLQKKQYAPIMPTIHAGLSFSIVHFLSAVRVAMLAPLLLDDSLQLFGPSLEQSPAYEDGAAGAGPGASPLLVVEEIVSRVRSNPGDPCVLGAQVPLVDLVRGVLRIFASKTAPLGAKGWKALASYERATRSWSWVGPTAANPRCSPDAPGGSGEATSPEHWGIPHKMLAKLVDSYANWLRSGQEILQQIGDLPLPPASMLQSSLDEKERFRDLRAQKSLNTINASSEEVRAYFQREEGLRYSIPDRAFSYTAADGRKSIVAPLRRCGGKPTSKARDHFMLKRDRPPHVTVLCLVRDAAARLPGSIGTRADVCTLIRDSQFIVEDVSDAQVNQVVSGALDRLHYERDPCVQFDGERKLWVYLHRDREEEDFEDDGTSSTKKWKRPRKDSGDQSDPALSAPIFDDGGGGPRLGCQFGSDLNIEPPAAEDDGVAADLLYNDWRQKVEGGLYASAMASQADPPRLPMVWDSLSLNLAQENSLSCAGGSKDGDFDNPSFGRESSVGFLSASML